MSQGGGGTFVDRGGGKGSECPALFCAKLVYFKKTWLPDTYGLIVHSSNATPFEENQCSVGNSLPAEV